MSSLAHHCEESLALFGLDFREVHIWLDKFAGSAEYGYRHRKKRHHEKGIQEIKKLFGEDAAVAARQHDISDLKEEGWTERDPFPKDEQDYIEMGLY